MSKMIRIMHLLQSNRYSGAENVACQIIHMFSSEYDMVYVCPKGPIEKALSDRNIKYVLLDSFSQKCIDKVVNEIKPNIIHAHDFNASIRAVKYRKKATIISHIHNNPLWLSQINTKSVAYAVLSKYYKTIIGVSPAVYNEYIFKNVIRNKFILLPNVVDKESIIKKSVSKGVNDIDLITVGRLTEQKDPLYFLEVVNELKKSFDDIHCVMIGEGPLKNDCEKYIEKYNLKQNVKMLGFTPNPYPYMKSAKVMFMPSKWEGFGLVAVESMILGVPVVCAPVGGLMNIVDNSCGYISDNTEEIIYEITRLISDHSLRQTKGKKSQEKAATFCNTSIYKAALKNIYDGIVVCE